MREQADRLVRIVDRYMPRVADENRAYVMHCPHKVGEMLKKAWKLRRKIRRRQKEEEGKAKCKRSSTSGTPERGEVQEGARRRTDEPAAKRGTTGETSLPSMKREASSPEVTPPDWGGDDDSDVDPTAETREEQEQEEASEAQWPWGPAGRPSDRRTSAGHLAQRPSEPVGEPPPRHLNLRGAQKPNEPERELLSSSSAIRATAAEADASGMREGGGRESA